MTAAHVTRPLALGAAWCERAESEMRARASALVEKGWSEADALREARWSVELALSRRAYRKQIDRALACQSKDDERALTREWVKSFGEEVARRLAGYVKSPRLVAASRSW